MTNNEDLCPACLSNGYLKYPEKIESNLFNDLTFASRKRPELMHYDLYECESCKTLFTNRNVNLAELLKNYENAEYDSSLEAKYAAKTYVKNLQKALPKFRGSVLDIGAGDGAFLSAAQGFASAADIAAAAGACARMKRASASAAGVGRAPPSRQISAGARAGQPSCASSGERSGGAMPRGITM